MEYIERTIFPELLKWIDRKEMIILKGPRQCGKTTLMRIAMDWLAVEKGVGRDSITFVTFEDREEMEKFAADPAGFVAMHAAGKGTTGRRYLFIDEAQYCPDIGQKLKLVYDTHENVKLFVTGSSSLELTAQTGRYLVGRAFSFDLHTFSFREFLSARDEKLGGVFDRMNSMVRGLLMEGMDFRPPEKDIHARGMLAHMRDYLAYGGYPEVVKAGTEEERRMVLKSIFNTYLEKDVISYLQITDTVKFRKLVSSLSAISGGLVSYEKLAAACGGYYKEVMHLLDVLEQTYVIRLLRPYHGSMVTELRKNPKVYFQDYGMRNHAIGNFNALDVREDAGRLAENFVLNEISAQMPDFPVNFWRTTSKAEVDIVLTAGSRLVPVEVKFENMNGLHVTRSLMSFIDNYSPEFAVVATKDTWGERVVGKTTVKFIPVVYF